MKVGTRVCFISTKEEYKDHPEWFPPIGTLGTVTCDDTDSDSTIEVQWDSGTSEDGKWWCYADDVEVVEEEGEE